MGSLLDVSDRIKFTKPPHGDFLWFNDNMSVRLIDQTSGSTSYSNSTAETEIVSLTAPANSLANGGALRFLASGSVVSDSTGVTPTVTWRVKGMASGSTSATTLLATSGVSVSRQPIVACGMLLLSCMASSRGSSTRPGWCSCPSPARGRCCRPRSRLLVDRRRVSMRQSSSPCR